MDARVAQQVSAEPRPAVSASRQVADGVLAALDEGRLAPGQRLVEADLCLRFGVGRNAVREALQQLASHGVVELNRHRGATVREVSPDQALRTLELTELLLGLAARSAAREIGAPGAAAQMRQALDRLSAAAAMDDDRPFLKARGSFYGALLRTGRNDELQRILATIHVHVLRAQYNFTRVHRRLQADFQAIGEAVLAGEATRAERAARRHVRHIRTILEQEFASPEERHG
ncbi:MAG: GntR family transcriptional regulator [Phenylobacterium sp.]|nr:GntR family transcriptional regulator [Phenylobacterium sp.]